MILSFCQTYCLFNDICSITNYTRPLLEFRKDRCSKECLKFNSICRECMFYLFPCKNAVFFKTHHNTISCTQCIFFYLGISQNINLTFLLLCQAKEIISLLLQLIKEWFDLQTYHTNVLLTTG